MTKIQCSSSIVFNLQYFVLNKWIDIDNLDILQLFTGLISNKVKVENMSSSLKFFLFWVETIKKRGEIVKFDSEKDWKPLLTFSHVQNRIPLGIADCCFKWLAT